MAGEYMENLMSRIIDQRYKTWEGHPTDPMVDPNLFAGELAYVRNTSPMDRVERFLDDTSKIRNTDRSKLPDEFVAQGSWILGYLSQAEDAHDYEAITGILESINKYPDRTVSQAIQF
jgi:hypothetical protein